MANLQIKKPIISEKTIALGEANKYVFAVDAKATKKTVAASVKETFNVEVTDVNIINTKGKPKRSGRHTFNRADVKKAIVTLKKGSKITMFEEGGSK